MYSPITAAYKRKNFLLYNSFINCSREFCPAEYCASSSMSSVRQSMEQLLYSRRRPTVFRIGKLSDEGTNEQPISLIRRINFCENWHCLNAAAQ